MWIHAGCAGITGENFEKCCEDGDYRKMINRGANFWNYGLKGACRGGHIEIVELMIKKGAGWCKWCCSTHRD